jgi:hypothetical protein
MKKEKTLKQIVDDSLEKVFWVSSVGHFENPSEYPQEFEQKFGNISFNTIVFDDYLIDINKLDELHHFLKYHSFDVVQQYKLNEYKSGYYFCDSARLFIKCSFGLPEEKIKEDDDDNIIYDSNSNGVVSISFCPHIINKDKIEKFLNEFVSKDFLFIPSEENKFYMIARNAQGLYNQAVDFEPCEIKDDNYCMYYGDNFPHEKMLEFVTNDDTDNLMILHGPPGTGKSEYLKHLFEASNRKVIYVPPSMLAMVSTPDFVSYMIENRETLIVIEDAEEILSTDRNAATQNLLGMSSGLLKSALDIKCICTLNCDIGKIDPALLRKGRLHFEHLFRKLTRDEGRRLAKFAGIDIEIDDDITLSEIFNNAPTSVKDNFASRPIGFHAS